MEARLLDSLHHKLDDLESTLRAHRGDLITDFQRFYHGLLRDVTPDVACGIERALVPSFANYPTLRPELEAADSGPPPPAFQQGPTPTVSFRIEASEGSRDRENELQGLFTPSYLPLLDCSLPTNVLPANSVVATSSITTSTSTCTSTTVPFPLLPLLPDETEHSGVDTGTSTGTGTGTGSGSGFGTGSGSGSGTAADTGQAAHAMAMDGLPDPSGAPSPATLQAPTGPTKPAKPAMVVRTTTDDSISSACSDKSDSKVRRSALRRSSSVSKAAQSPRRVRFEFMGAEVLPTTSPQPSEFIAPSASAQFPEDESVASDTILGDDVEEFEPPPRKISSSEALRALSRTPMGEDTVWTVVNPNADEAAPQDASSGKSSSVEKRVPPTADPEPKTNVEVLEGSRSDEDHDVDNSSDEDDFLAMAKPKSSAKKKSVLTPMPRQPAKETNNGYSSITSTLNQLSTKSYVSGDGKPHDEGVDDYDDVFHFEPAGLSAPPKPRQPPPPPKLDEISDDESHESLDETQPTQALYATSPAVSIIRPSRMEPTTPTMSRFQPGSLGSYKGRPVIMPVVRDPELHARAASLGHFTTFVGGLDGRSGMDEGDLSSFRASVVQPEFNGAPRSFTERYMLEEAQAERERSKGSVQ